MARIGFELAVQVVDDSAEDREEKRIMGVSNREKWLETSNAETKTHRFVDDIERTMCLKMRGPRNQQSTK